MLPLLSTTGEPTPVPDSVSHRVNAERLMLLGWSRAILLQLAHPLVAAGVADHSSFRGGPFAAATRLRQTVRAMLSLTFGGEKDRTATLERIRAIHRRVHGRLPMAAGIFPASTPYSAEDPALLLWVHVTLLESIPLVYERLVAPLTETERDAYCREAAAVVIDLGARSDEVPRRWSDVKRYLDRVYSSGAITVSAQARELAVAVLSPPFAPLIAPVAGINRLVTAGLLPEAVRDQYGFAWSHAHERRLARAFAAVRACRRLLPRHVAWWPEARARGVGRDERVSPEHRAS
jgi:uncharacterized protein (DUF2236 family)